MMMTDSFHTHCVHCGMYLPIGLAVVVEERSYCALHVPEPKSAESEMLPCPHGRPSWKMCPHCLQLNANVKLQEVTTTPTTTLTFTDDQGLKTFDEIDDAALERLRVKASFFVKGAIRGDATDLCIEDAKDLVKALRGTKSTSTDVKVNVPVADQLVRAKEVVYSATKRQMIEIEKERDDACRSEREITLAIERDALLVNAEHNTKRIAEVNEKIAALEARNAALEKVAEQAEWALNVGERLTITNIHAEIGVQCNGAVKPWNKSGLQPLRDALAVLKAGKS